MVNNVTDIQKYNICNAHFTYKFSLTILTSRDKLLGPFGPLENSPTSIFCLLKI